MIAAVGRNFEIGHNNGLPWKCPKDLVLFKQLTHGFPVMMGIKTANSLRRPLEGRKNIVLIRRFNLHIPFGFHMATLHEALRRYQHGWVIGGGVIYEALLPHVNEIWLTHIDIEAQEADTFFPFEAMEKLGFKPVETMVDFAGDENNPPFKQIVYRLSKQ